MIIRCLHRLSEIEPVRALAVAQARYEKSSKIVPLDWAARMNALVEAGQLDLFVAEREGTPVGYASMNRVVGTWLAEPYATSTASLSRRAVAAGEWGGCW